MAPGGKLLLVALCLVLQGAVHNVLGTGHIEVHFLRYTDDCNEHLGLDKCDPMFSFCMSTPQTGSLSVDNCKYASTGESRDHYQNTNHVDMEYLTSILGHKNPWVVKVNKFTEPSVMLVIKVRDKDLIFHDHMQTWGKVLTEKIWPSIEQSVWAERVMTSGSYTMRFKVRMYCDAYYYTTTCDKYCKPEDSNAGHYKCDSTGNKICLPGWQGSECTEDINECYLGYCINGECINLPGDYKCNCSANFTGKNCTDLMNPCRSHPCQNGGTCYAHSKEHNYICTCTQGWSGKNCENQTKQNDPCRSNPCLNNGSCASSPDNNYSCSCVSPYTGGRCESAVPSTTIPTRLETLPPSTSTIIITTSTTPELPPSTIKMTNDSTLPTDSQDANVQHLSQEDDDSGFQPWYIAVILAVLLVVLIVLIILFIRRRRRKAEQDLVKADMSVTYNGDNLAFENGMYNSANRNNSVIERQTRHLPPVPINPTDEELFNASKPAYAEVNETEGATARWKGDNSDLKKTSDPLRKNSDPNFGLLNRPLSSRAQTNPYSDFRSLRDSQVEPDKDNNQETDHYHNLDDITISLEAVHDDDNVYDESDDDMINYDIQENPVVTVQSSPYDIPSNNSSYYASPKPTMPSPLLSHRNEDLTKNDEDVFASADDVSDSSDDDTLQEDVTQLRKEVEENLTPYGTPKS